MSGPKVSVYEMSAIQRHNLRAQLNCLQQSVVCCEEIKKSVGYLNGLNGQIHSLLTTFNLVNQRSGDCFGEIAMLDDFQSQIPQDCQSYMEQLLSDTPNIQVDKITLTDAELDKRKELLSKLQSLRNSVVARQNNVEEALNPMKAKAKQGVRKVEDAIAEDVSGVKSFFIVPTESDEERFAAQKKSLNEQLRIMALSDDYPADLKGEVVSVASVLSRVTTKEQFTTFQAVTIKPLFQKIENLRMQAIEQRNEFENLQLRYIALCSVAGVQPEAFFQAGNATAKMREKIAALEKQVVMQTEQVYISDCVNEVMTEMGYDVIGNRSVTKRSGKRFRNELFSYGEGTAINVTYDSDGQIAMELGGIDRADRIPTAEEADALREDMESFCSNFKDFEERLKARGIMIKSRVSMAPPTVEYATIINVSDYTITAARPVKEIAVKEARAKSISKRTLRRMDN